MFEDHKILYVKLLAVKMILIESYNIYQVQVSLYLLNIKLDDNIILVSIIYLNHYLFSYILDTAFVLHVAHLFVNCNAQLQNLFYVISLFKYRHALLTYFYHILQDQQSKNSHYYLPISLIYQDNFVPLLSLILPHFMIILHLNQIIEVMLNIIGMIYFMNKNIMITLLKMDSFH